VGTQAPASMSPRPPPGSRRSGNDRGGRHRASSFCRELVVAGRKRARRPKLRADLFEPDDLAVLATHFRVEAGAFRYGRRRHRPVPCHQDRRQEPGSFAVPVRTQGVLSVVEPVDRCAKRGADAHERLRSDDDVLTESIDVTGVHTQRSGEGSQRLQLIHAVLTTAARKPRNTPQLVHVALYLALLPRVIPCLSCFRGES
jgi:hypothetical protein